MGCAGGGGRELGPPRSWGWSPLGCLASDECPVTNRLGLGGPIVDLYRSVLLEIHKICTLIPLARRMHSKSEDHWLRRGDCWL